MDISDKETQSITLEADQGMAGGKLHRFCVILKEGNIKRHESILHDTPFILIHFQCWHSSKLWLLCLLTLVSRFTGFPRSHSIWEPFWFAWHLIYSWSGYQDVISAKTEIQTDVTSPLQHCNTYLRWDSGAGIRQSVWKGDEQLSGVSVVSVLLRVQRVRGHVGDGDLQHYQPLVRQGEHLHVILVSTWMGKKKRKHTFTVVHSDTSSHSKGLEQKEKQTIEHHGKHP